MIRYYDSDVEGLEVSADMTNVILMFHPLDPLRPLSWNTLDDFYNWILRFCSGNKRSVPVSGKRYLLLSIRLNRHRPLNHHQLILL